MKMNEKYNGEPMIFTFANEVHSTFTLVVEEGTGDNLWDEDIENGYVDYINWTMYAIKMDCDLPVFTEWDGGMVLTQKYVQDMTIEEIWDRVHDEVGGTLSAAHYASEMTM